MKISSSQLLNLSQQNPRNINFDNNLIGFKQLSSSDLLLVAISNNHFKSELNLVKCVNLKKIVLANCSNLKLLVSTKIKLEFNSYVSDITFITEDVNVFNEVSSQIRLYKSNLEKLKLNSCFTGRVILKLPKENVPVRVNSFE